MKVLIMSHNPITDYNSMGKTLLGLFSTFSEDELCQFYVYPTLPNIKVCESYYRITDREALFGIVKRSSIGRVITDSEIKCENTLYEDLNVSRLYNNKDLHKELKIFTRDLIWRLSSTKKQGFYQWLTEEKPDVIFAAPGASGFFYQLISDVAQKLGIPIVTYICDDFYFSNQEKKAIIKRLYGWYIRKEIKNLIKKSEQVITISEELARDYRTEFGCECTVISTGSNLTRRNMPVCGNGEIISYFGNLQIGRYLPLAEIAKKVDAYNAESGRTISMNIYSADNSLAISRAFENISCAHFCGFLPANEMYDAMKRSSVLLHVESFEKENRKRVKYSISTKIADSLASGICIFAYGPSEVASIKYLKKNECALVATEEGRLYEKLAECLNNPKRRREIAAKALDVAERNHSSMCQSELLRAILTSV